MIIYFAYYERGYNPTWYPLNVDLLHPQQVLITHGVASESETTLKIQMSSPWILSDQLLFQTASIEFESKILLC